MYRKLLIHAHVYSEHMAKSNLERRHPNVQTAVTSPILLEKRYVFVHPCLLVYKQIGTQWYTAQKALLLSKRKQISAPIHNVYAIV